MPELVRVGEYTGLLTIGEGWRVISILTRNVVLMQTNLYVIVVSRVDGPRLQESIRCTHGVKTFVLR